MQAILKAENLEKSYGGRKVLDSVSLQVSAGEIVGLLGPNGAGKTTSFYICVGLIAPDAGKVNLNNQDITYSPMYLRARQGLGYLPQEPSVFRKLTVSENIMAILENIEFNNQVEREEKLEEILQDLKLENRRNIIASALSGGERRRTEIARALACNPKFLLLDEPFSGIDPKVVEELQRIIVDLKSRNIGILITDHNFRETLHISDRAYVLAEGQVVEQGTSEQIYSSPLARKYYLGNTV